MVRGSTAASVGGSPPTGSTSATTTTGFISGSDPTRIVTRPFFNTETGLPDTQLVNVPGELQGTVEVNASDDFSGGGIGLQHCLWKCCDPCGCGPSSRGYLLGGYRHYKYDSDLVITENLTVLPGTTTPLVPGTTIFLQDAFRTENEFHGGELGFQGFVQHRAGGSTASQSSPSARIAAP